MGFRGEALASIAAIAKVQMLSKAIGQDNGYQIDVEGGDIVDKHEAGCAPGTSITVKELFYNTPVRYKFLKKDFTESGYIEDAIKRLALVNPNISFKFINNGKIELQTSGNGRMEDVVYAIYGKEVLENIIPVDYQYEDIYIKGVIGKPMIARSNRTNQLFFVNKRFIKDKTLSSAAEQGFKGLVTIGKHGFLILNLEMDPKKLDVNVHPTKMEVRFQEESKVFKAVFHSIKDTMLKTDLITNHEKEHFSDENVDFEKDVKNDNLTNSARLKFWGLNKEEKFNEKENRDFDFFRNLKSPNIKDVNVVNDAQYGEKSEFEVDDKIGKINEELDKIQKSRNNKIEYDLNRYDHLGDNASVADKMNLLNDTVGNDYGIVNNESDDTLNSNDKNGEDKLEGISEVSSENNDNDAKTNVDLKIQNVNDDLNNSDQLDNPLENNPKIENLSVDNNKIEENQENYKYEENKIVNNNQTDSNDKNIENDVIINDKDISFEEKYKKLFGRDIQTAKQEYQNQKKNEDVNLKPIEGEKVSLFESKDDDVKKPHYNYVGIAFKTYIIFTINDEMYMMDQHAAHERIMFEKVKANYYNDVDKDSQLMLLPDIITLSNKEMGIFRDNKDLFNKAGFTVDEFGDNTVKLTGVPEFCLDFDTRSLFLDTLDEMDTVARTAKQELEYKFLATVACKAAVKAHMALSKEEVDSLFEQLYKLPNPFSCPHGRPTVIKMTKTDIEKKFSRIQ